MKKLYLFLLIAFSTSLFSQDIILQSNGLSIDSKIEEIGVDQIKYRKYSNTSGPIYIIPKKKVAQVTFENGDTEKFSIIDDKEERLSELKTKILDYINKYGYDDNSNSKPYTATFEDNHIRMIVLRKSGNETNDNYLFDFSNVYKFGKVDKRKKDLAFLNIWVSLQTNVKKNKWKEYKLVIRVKGHKYADRLLRALKEYNELLYMTD